MSAMARDLAVADYERFARVALPMYQLESATVTLLSYSENGTFLVESETGRQVLRVHRPGYHSLAAIESELDWMESLRSDSAITTPQVIPAPDGRRVVEARIGDDVCLVDMFTFVEGTIAEDDASDISFSELGAITATLHEHVQRWQRPETFTRFRWDLGTMLGVTANTTHGTCTLNSETNRSLEKNEKMPTSAASNTM